VKDTICWKRCAQQLLEDQALTELSADLFAAYCDAVGDYDRIRRALNQKPRVVETTRSGRARQIAEIGISNRALARMLKLGEIFAIDPYARSRRGLRGTATDDERPDRLFTPAADRLNLVASSRP
jgi:phage terminase small subunit